MIRKVSVFVAFCSIALPLLGAPDNVKLPSEAEIAKMNEASPAKPTAIPIRPRKILIVSQCEGFFHSSIPYVEKAFELMGRKTGAFETTVVEDMSILEDPVLDTFDAILMNNTTMRLPLLNIDTANMDEAQKKAAEERENKARERFLNFVRSGKGLIGVHAATDCLYKWPEYGEMMGGFFSGHPWHENVAVKLDDPGHPLLKAFNGQTFEVTDEIYQFRDPYSRDKLRVLMSLDVNRTNMDKGDKIKRKDNDFAVAWIHNYGKGRVFYFSLGHRHEIMWNPAVMQCYLGGTQYALGDFQVDATPSAKLSKKYLDDSRVKGFSDGLVNIFDQLVTYEFGRNDTIVKQINDMVVQYQKGTDKAARNELSRRLAAVAANPEATDDARLYSCRQLGLIGTENAVAPLASLLTDETMTNRARFALERIPSQSVDTVLIEALTKTSGKTCAGIADSLGQRKTKKAVNALIEVLSGSDAAASVAAANALGEIGGKKAMTALLAKNAPQDSTLQPVLNRAILACAEKARPGWWSKKTAKKGYARLLNDPDAAPHIHAAAMYGAAMIKGKRGIADAMAALVGDDPEMARAGARLVEDLKSRKTVPAISAALPNMSTQNQALALDAMAARGDVRAQEAALKLLSAEEIVALAALGALEAVGDHAAVMPVIATAANEDAPEAVRNKARQTLTRMKGKGIDKVLIDAIEEADVKKKTEYVIALGERKATSALPTLFKTARSDDRTLRKESCKAIGLLATTPDLPEIIKLLVETPSSTARGQLENIAVSVARKTEDETLKTKAILTALSGDIEPKATCSLLSALGEIGAANGLDTLLSAIDSKDDSIKRAAIKALAESWPDATPMSSLRDVSVNAENPVHRVLALRGYARMLAMPSHLPMRETLASYREALDLAKGEQEKRALLGGLAKLCHPDALDFVRPYLKDKSVQAEALLAAISISQNLDGKSMSFDASSGKGKERNAIDGSSKTRWTSGKAMAGGEWFMVDLGYETAVKEIYLDAGPEGRDQPRGYEVYVSLDKDNWGKAVATGGDPGEKAFTITFPPKYGRFVKIIQTGSCGMYWSINEMRINGRPETTGKTELDRSKWKVSASRSGGNDAPENAIDGDLQKRWGTGGAMKPGDWFQVDLSEEQTVYRVVMDAAKSGNDYPRQFRVFTSLDGEDWYGPIGAGEGTKAQTTVVLLPTKARFVKIEQTGQHERNWWSIYDLKIIGE